MQPSLFVRAIVLAAAAACLGAQAQTTLYRWVDKDGRVQYTDTPPPPDAKGATAKRFGDGPPDSSLPYATQQAMRTNPVMLWTAPNCPACDDGRELLSQRGIPFSERNVQANAETQQALKELMGALKVPVLEVGLNRIQGFERGEWSAALDNAGYPKERAVGQTPTRPTMANLPSRPKEANAEAAPAQQQ